MLSAIKEWEVLDKSSMDDQLKHRAAFEVNPRGGIIHILPSIKEYSLK